MPFKQISYVSNFPEDSQRSFILQRSSEKEASIWRDHLEVCMSQNDVLDYESIIMRWIL